MNFKLVAQVFLCLICAVPTLAQNKMLTVEDIFDATKRVNFNGTTPSIRWLKDGTHYLLTNEASRRDVPRLQKVDAATGEAVHFSIRQRCKPRLLHYPGLVRKTLGSFLIVVRIK
jgi:hypothetical protein